MSGYQLEPLANARIDEIYIYTRERWGEDQAWRYLRGLFDRFDAIADRRVPWRVIPADFGTRGYFCRYEHHTIYWKLLDNGLVGIVTILHERMHRIDRLADEME